MSFQQWQIEMLNLVNAERARYHRRPLNLDIRLCHSAQEHSNYQAHTNAMTHNDSSGPLMTRVQRRVPNIRGCAENVAWNQPDVRSVVQGWINSPGHHRNMLGEYNIVGFGIQNKYWTQVFALA
ncbi:PR-1-like protein [Linderina pennispora]|uniref:PR-1-like protein n=1 Tax=Linderina pennispora TaxID=61395 RepID=A0A1Y1VY06_9FUNG|nr:PR-1-like protein [Linderina pennispora]ORX66169.1 PR-1-like protein [Linderina pennispora]